MTQVKDIMKKCFVALRPETTLAEAVQSLGENHVDSAPVMSADRSVVGMISEHELMDVLFDRTVRDTPISEYMVRDLVTLEASDPLSLAAQMLVLHGFRKLPVVENGVLVGIVTRRDLLNHALESDDLFTEPLIDLMPELRADELSACRTDGERVPAEGILELWNARGRTRFPVPKIPYFGTRAARLSLENQAVR